MVSTYVTILNTQRNIGTENIIPVTNAIERLREEFKRDRQQHGVSRVLARFVARVIIAVPLQVKAIAQAHVKTDKIDAGTLASTNHAAGVREALRQAQQE